MKLIRRPSDSRKNILDRKPLECQIMSNAKKSTAIHQAAFLIGLALIPGPWLCYLACWRPRSECPFDSIRMNSLAMAKWLSTSCWNRRLPTLATCFGIVLIFGLEQVFGESPTSSSPENALPQTVSLETPFALEPVVIESPGVFDHESEMIAENTTGVATCDVMVAQEAGDNLEAQEIAEEAEELGDESG